jgi:hypothetical protein
MIPHIRQRYNAEFNEAKYQTFLADLADTYQKDVVFRVAETPVFVPADFQRKMREASEHIIDRILQPDFMDYSQRALQPQFTIPNETPHPHFICIDFAVCRTPDGELIPQLIELQGCASLLCFQHFVGLKYAEHFYCPDNFSHLYDGLTPDEYIANLKAVIIGKHNPENVILLEIKPHEQKTRIDFYATEAMLGVRPVCVSEVIVENDHLFYMRDGVKTPIKRIYNRVIAEDFEHYPDLNPQFDMTKPIAVEWVGHPNWFFRISKYTMPLLDHAYIPKSRFLSDFKDDLPQDLENYVLKPLFSFAGSGVIIEVTQADIDAIPLDERQNYLLQRKVAYAPAIETTNTPAKVELRMMYVWHDGEPRPRLLTNLGRMSKGLMIGVRYNANNDWVGGTVGIVEQAQ